MNKTTLASLVLIFVCGGAYAQSFPEDECCDGVECETTTPARTP